VCVYLLWEGVILVNVLGGSGGLLVCVFICYGRGDVGECVWEGV
jgi:hypothetical protein